MTSWKDRLRPFAGYIEEMAVLIRVMDDAELKKLAEACRRPTRTNSGWSTYQAARLISGEVDAELNRRLRPDYSRPSASANGGT